MTAKHARRTAEKFDHPLVPPDSAPSPMGEPDEVSIDFATVPDGPGRARPLPESLILATVLTAVELERNSFVPTLTHGSESIEACAPVYWPILVVPVPTGERVALFDGTGAWRRTFRYTRLPPVEEVQSLLAEPRPAQEWLPRFRTLAAHFAPDPGGESMTIEGFLPVDPVLLFDLLAPVDLKSGPKHPPAGYLPPRHDYDWFRTSVKNMELWLQRFDSDLLLLGGLKQKVHARAETITNELDAEYRKSQASVHARVRAAHEQMDREAEALHIAVREELRAVGSSIREARVAIARGRTQMATSETLASRAIQRRRDPEIHHARSRRHDQEVRDAEHAIREAHRRAEVAHARERGLLDTMSQRVAQVEEEGAVELSRVELLRDEVTLAAQDFAEAVDGQVAARTQQREQLQAYFLPLPNLREIRIVWFPLWVVSLWGPRGVRFRVFPPMQVTPPSGLSSRLKTLLGGVVLPLEPRAAQFDRAFRDTIEGALASDPWLAHAMRELVRAADVIAQPEFLDQASEGLAELRRAGWIRPKREARLLAGFRSLVQARPANPSSTTVPPPWGTGPNDTA